MNFKDRQSQSRTQEVEGKIGEWVRYHTRSSLFFQVGSQIEVPADKDEGK